MADRVLASFIHATNARTAGFNSVDTGAMHTVSWLGTIILMFIGAGSGGTGGGIKVTTFAVLGVVIWSELRGEPDANLFDRRISQATQRQALTVALLAARQSAPVPAPGERADHRLRRSGATRWVRWMQGDGSRRGALCVRTAVPADGSCLVGRRAGACCPLKEVVGGE